MDLDEMQSCIETLLFMSDKPLSVKKLQELLGPELPHSLFQEAVTALRDQYTHSRHGIEVVEIAGGLQFRTKPGRAALAKKLSKVQTQRLSSGAMETLAIIAYRQPAMKEDVDKIRGVDSSYFVRQLLDRKLIAISGRSDLPGRPMVYSTTDEFLALFGLKDLTAMPSLRELEQMIPSSQSNNPEDEDPRIREMRRLVDEMKSDSSTSLIYNPEEDENILKEIREKVNSIPTSTPYLEEQKALEKQAKELLAAQTAEAQALAQQATLELT
jgi:segregation and condensation protein B